MKYKFKKIKEELQKCNLTQTSIKLGLSQSMLRKIKNGTYDFKSLSIKNYEKLLKILEIEE